MTTKIISVSEVGLLFGIWKNSQFDYKNCNIVVVNKKNHRIVGAFRFIEPPLPVEEKCPTCAGAGKVEVKYGLER